MSKNPKNWWKSMKIANIDREILHNFWTTWRISKKSSGKMWLMIIKKVTKNQGFTLSLEDTFFEKPQWGRQIVPPPSPPAIFGLRKPMQNLVDIQTYKHSSWKKVSGRAVRDGYLKAICYRNIQTFLIL